jgi:hypothetical protein
MITMPALAELLREDQAAALEQHRARLRRAELDRLNAPAQPRPAPAAVFRDPSGGA